MINELNNNEISSDSGRRKRPLKGMTLMEVIIAMVVLVILASLCVEAAVGIISNVRTSKSVVQKVNYQSSFVTARSGSSSGTLSFKLVDDKGSEILADEENISVNIFEAPVDPAGKYKDYDKAGNLKYFVHP